MKFSIVKYYKIFLSLTIIFLLFGVGSMVIKGFNLGVDYTGGSIMDISFEKPVTVAGVREVLDKYDLGNSVIQLEAVDGSMETSKDVLIRTVVIDEDQRRDTLKGLEDSLGGYEVKRIEHVGATVGRELVNQAILSIVLSWILMIIYITMRFEIRFAAAAVISLIIDISVVLSYFSFLQLEIDSSFVAALLTVVGFSINGTIVVFDRIRENLKLHRRSESLSDLVDESIWQCMTRTLYTNFTALFSVVAILIFGGMTIRNFAFAMFVGFSSGVYTSVLLAGPMWRFFKEYKKAA